MPQYIASQKYSSFYGLKVILHMFENHLSQKPRMVKLDLPETKIPLVLILEPEVLTKAHVRGLKRPPKNGTGTRN